jgi:hypothetical protein
MAKVDQLTRAVGKLERILRPGLTPERLEAALVKVLHHAQQADPDSRNRAVGQLAQHVATVPLAPASFLAVGCGALVEYGADPHAALEPVTARTREALAEASVYAEACRARGRSSRQPDDPDDVDVDACIEKFGQQVGDQMPDQADAWISASNLLRAMTALLAHSPSARAAARADNALVAAVDNILGLADPGCAGFVHKLLNVLDGQELIVLHPGAGRGYRVRIEGIVDNFQLDTLLADALIGDPGQGWLPGNRPDRAVVDAAKRGPVTDSLPTAFRNFKLVNWHGLRADSTLADGQGDHEHWIWSEGIPADIAPFEGELIVLLGEPAYPFAANAGRMFEGMPGDLRVVEQLPPEAVRARLDRIAAAVAARG